MTDALLDGYRRFRADVWPQQRKVFEHLAMHGQFPQALVVSCVDSRVDPSVIFDGQPGDFLTVRNVANLVPPYAPDSAYHGTSAALEFGVCVLKVPRIIVLGHESCGGVRSLLQGAPETARDFVTPWMTLAADAKAVALQRSEGEDRQHCCEQEVVRVSLSNLMTFPWIAERVAVGELKLQGYWFSIHAGILETIQPDGSFGPVV